ncbi:Calponin-3 [Lamellibrachia satsuma]|nr:Calponin-3 [Lamellibrachia satsuma]
MANRPRSYGLTAEVRGKLAAKYDIEKEQEARLWIEAVVGEPVDSSVPESEALGMDRFHAALKDGILLCKLADAITGPGKVKFNRMKVPFKQMENINNFLVACENYGVAKTDLFQTVDLFENQNLWQVVCTIHAFGRKAQTMGFQGPCLGPREAAKNVREFSEDQLQAGQTVIGLQMGTNKVASQKGMSFGNTRHIADIRCDDVSKEGQSMIGLQMGSNQGASQAGQNFGKSRGILGPDQ